MLHSQVTNLVAGQIDRLFSPDVFLYNRLTDTTTLVSRSATSALTTANFDFYEPIIRPNGRYVVVISQADNLVAGQSGINRGNLLVFDLVMGINTLVSHAAGAFSVNGDDRASSPVSSSTPMKIGSHFHP